MSDTKMLYVVVLQITGSDKPPFDALIAKLEGLEATRLLMEYSWLLQSSKSAMELYVELAPDFEVERHDNRLVIAEVTANSAGTHIVRRDVGLTAMLSAARRV